jgi:SAM-dependent methyltransferase
VDAATWDRLRSSFGGASVAYDEHRPDYAADAVSWALAAAPGPRVVDIGAGTGKLTAALVALNADVVAVEPDPSMRAELERALPGVLTLEGAAEQVPLPAGSVDAAVAGNAMHWFDMAAAGPEIARVLAPGGTLAGLWNIFDDRVPWVAELARIGGPMAIGRRDLFSQWSAETVDVHVPRDGSEPVFGSGEQRVFAHGHRRTAASLVATFATKAGILVMPADERERLLERIGAYLSQTPETSGGEFTAPMLTGVLRLQRARSLRDPT